MSEFDKVKLKVNQVFLDAYDQLNPAPKKGG